MWRWVEWIDWWVKWIDWPQFAIGSLVVWLLRLALKTSDNLFTDPLAVKLASLMRKAARALVTPARRYVVAAEGHAAGSAVVIGHAPAYVLRAATGHFELGGSDASFRHSRLLSAGPMMVSGSGTVGDPPA